MKYAVININGSQFKVEEGEEILVDHTDSKKLNVSVLLYVDGDKVKVGKPEVAGVDVKLKELKDLEKGKKILVSKYKAKSRYRKKMGFRHQFTRLQVVKITSK